MPPQDSPGRPHFSSTTIPDLTDKITRQHDQCSEGGAFGDVFRCRYTNADGVKEVAVKAFRFKFTVDECSRDDGGKTARMIRRELGIWSRLNHRNIVPFLGIAYGFGRQGSASLVSVWMPHGTLHPFLEAHGDQLAVPHRLQLLLDIANGLHYLHSFPLVHGDLTSNNVLLDHNYNACLTDFGCTSLVGEHPEGYTYLKMSTVRPGTIRWAAPEHFSDEETKHTTKSDIYSFGNMILLVLSGQYPWSEIRNDPAVMYHLFQGHKPSRPLERPINDRYWALIERCWSSIPERPPAEDVVSSLQQLLDDAGPPPPPLRGLLDNLTLSSVPNDSTDDDIDVSPTVQSWYGSTVHQAVNGSASPAALEAIPHPSTSTPAQVRLPLVDERKDVKKNSTAKGFREGTVPADDDEAQRYSLTGWKDKIPARADEDDSQKQPERAGMAYRYIDYVTKRLYGVRAMTGYSDSNPSGPNSKEGHIQATAGYSYGSKPSYSYTIPSPQSTGPGHRLHEEETVSQKRPTTSKNVGDAPSDGESALSKIILGDLLAQGAHGRIYLALDGSTGEMIAVKQVKKDNMDGRFHNSVLELKKEREILRGLDHPHIITYFGFKETTITLSLLMEYIPGGSIGSRLRQYGKFNGEVVKSFTAQILNGLAYLHVNRTVHRNIRVNNILVASSGICKITGFGNAQRVEDDGATWIPLRGSAPWTAPEIIQEAHGGKLYSPKADIWGAGCVVLRMWIGGGPGDGERFTRMVKAARQGAFEAPLWNTVTSDLAIDFMRRCFAVDPEARTDAIELMQHAYLTLAPGWVFTGFT